MDRRTEEQKLAGIIPVRWGGEVRHLPTLKRGPARLWKTKLVEKTTSLGGVNVSEIAALGAAANLASDEMFNLIREYDQGSVLGSPEWIDEHVDDTEIYDCFRAVLDVSFPFVTDLRGLIAEVRPLLALSASQASTNGASPSGGSIRKRSTPASTTAS